MSLLATAETSAFFHEASSLGRGEFAGFCHGGIDVHGHGVAGIRGGSGTFGFETVSRLFYPPGILSEGDCFLRPVVEGFLHIDIEGDGVRNADRDAFGEDLNGFEIVDF